jgi:hypothetical protein
MRASMDRRRISFCSAVLLLALGTSVRRSSCRYCPDDWCLSGRDGGGGSDFHHQVEDDIRPFRDVLTGLLFLTVGMEINPAIVAEVPFALLAWLIAFLPVKALILMVAGDQRHSVECILHSSRQENPNVASIVSATDDQNVTMLANAGAGTVFPENGPGAGRSSPDNLRLPLR